MSTQSVVHELDLMIQRLQSYRPHAIRAAQLEAEVKRAEQTLAGLQGQIAQVQPMVAQIEELDQRIKLKRHELAELELQISKKSVEHGSIDAELGALVKRARSLVQPTN